MRKKSAKEKLVPRPKRKPGDPIVTFYNCDPKDAPKTTMPAHLGSNAIITCRGRILLERRRDSDVWALIGGGCKDWETGRQAIAREVKEELGITIPQDRFKKLKIYDNPGRIAAFRDGSVWRMVIVMYGLEMSEEPEMKVSRESRELRFFTKEEAEKLTIAVTHADILRELYLEKEP